MKAVFDSKPGSRYDDEVATRYHFPKRGYLEVAVAAIGDWIVYREPRENHGSMAYFAAARVASVVDDPLDATNAYALMDGFIPFDAPVPFSSEGRYEEGPLRSLTRRAGVGVALRGRSVRPLADEDFAAIIIKGLGVTFAEQNAVRLGLDGADRQLIVSALVPQLPAEAARQVVQLLMNRKIRDASFRQKVLAAYGDTCAVTGLRIINGGGRAEAQAAHIVPVADDGLDVVQNGIALSGTAHWLFDRHLISIDENYRLLVAHNRLPEQVREILIRTDRELHLPADERLRPAPHFVARHRERFGCAH
ncbi:HNH endonuclease [Sphingopyxis sp. YF1]|uniref:HNH endonuclease n=1 Tax=Sphingopyxis sp. YF1 TaxID=2482763 RepID=UPI001F608182|nr:HNH endonuclease [Sphingopyxis sp. YF1]UNU43753.1 HNH endonuclease [Sphingopyxis sp. YF1]